MEYIVVAVAVVALAVIVHASLEGAVARRAFPVLLLAFAARLLVHVFVTRSGVIHYGGDNRVYEIWATEIVASWKSAGFHVVTAEENPALAGVALPCHLFAVVMYLCGGPAPLACTAVVAVVACALCVVMYRFARLLGADERAAFLLLVVTAFLPSFLLHTSDTYKDGLNAFLVVASLYLGVSMARRFEVRKVLILGCLLWALWNVRSYMVFMCLVPLAVSLLGVDRGFSPRRLLAFGALLAGAAFIYYGVIGSAAVEVLMDQLDTGQSDVVRQANGDGGSGVSFDDGGSAWSSLGLKLLYTVFSPFPWAQGSLALQLGKIDALVSYFLLFAAVRGARFLWRTDRRVLIILLFFLVPGVIVYSTTMANVGLIFRQRMPIVMVASLLAAVRWTRNSRGGQQSNAPAEIELNRI
ncbi:hypothetical protein [Microbispora bryophytorum]|uniref:hypothetical protein n=1 Tax=Microbispora bryophytorum TaxID=1460882 RepID=UPI0033FEB832